MNISWNPQNLWVTLPYLAAGMISIFIVIGVIMGATVLLNKVFAEKKEDEKQ